jgi:hypothetical protein
MTGGETSGGSTGIGADGGTNSGGAPGGSDPGGTGQGGAGQGGSLGGSAGSAQGGSGGAGVVEYQACGGGAAIVFISLYRIDRSANNCTMLVIQEGAGACNPLALVSEDGGWCLSRAILSTDLASCEAHEAPTDGVAATGVSGSLTVQMGVVDIDVSLDFPGGSALPETVNVQVGGCASDCDTEDCRQ